MSQIDSNLPEEGEEIHLPGPSVEPLLITIGVTAALVGVTVSPVLIVLGGLLTIWQTTKWIRETRDEIAELPADHH